MLMDRFFILFSFFLFCQFPIENTKTTAQLNIEYPMLFELENPDTQQHTHCGVLEFTAPEGFVFVPSWVFFSFSGFF